MKLLLFATSVPIELSKASEPWGTDKVPRKWEGVIVSLTALNYT